MYTFDFFDEDSLNVNLGDLIRLRDFAITMFNFIKSKDLLTEFNQYKEDNNHEYPL